MAPNGSTSRDLGATPAMIRSALRERGQRWTPQRRVLVDVLTSVSGHVTGAEIIQRCRAVEPGTTPSTVYRALDVLEELGLVRHSHGADGREEYHVRPDGEHAHLHCTDCGRSWDIPAAEARRLVRGLEEARDFEIEVSHISIAGRCADCRAGRST